MRKRLKAVVELWLPAWEERRGVLKAEDKAGLLKISGNQIDRVLAKYRSRGKWSPKPGSKVRRQVPIRTGPGQVASPGWVEVDTVAHCGGSMGGSFAWSVVMSDIYSGWTEVRASWNRSDRVVQSALKQCQEAQPFVLRGYDSDNGTGRSIRA